MKKCKLELKKDYLLSIGVSGGADFRDLGFDHVYLETNEDLVDAYRQIDFKDKNVLSVLASSDQMFTAKVLGAKNVDVFDYNKLTYYYYFLRKWSILYLDTLFPDVSDKKWIDKLLKMVVPKNDDEIVAKKFWLLQLENKNFEQLFMNYDMQPDGKTIYKNCDSIKEFINDDVTFYHMNLFKKNDLSGEYDIILLSNILDWAKNDYNLLSNAFENLQRLLKPGGIILCSRLTSESVMNESEIFNKYSYHDFSNNQNYLYTKTL